jgi:hypothetical protein
MLSGASLEMSTPNTSAATSPTSTPSQFQIFVADNRAAIVGTLLVSHGAHWSYITRVGSRSPVLQQNRAYFGRLGLAWAGVYAAVLTTLTIAHRDVSNASDPLLRGRYR